MVGAVAKFIFIIFFTRQLQDLPPEKGTFLRMKEREKKKGGGGLKPTLLVGKNVTT
jgi:hypothetical protein